MILSLLFATSVSAETKVYVTEAGSPDASSSEAHPFHTVESGIATTSSAGTDTVSIGSASYYESLTLTDPVIPETPPEQSAIIADTSTASTNLTY